MANEIVKKEKGIANYLSSPAVKENIISVLGEKNVDAFVTDVVACVQANNTLGACTNASIFSAALVSKSMNLPLTPQLGYAYLVPLTTRNRLMENRMGKRSTAKYWLEGIYPVGFA